MDNLTKLADAVNSFRKKGKVQFEATIELRNNLKKFIPLLKDVASSPVGSFDKLKILNDILYKVDNPGKVLPQDKEQRFIANLAYFKDVFLPLLTVLFGKDVAHALINGEDGINIDKEIFVQPPSDEEIRECCKQFVANMACLDNLSSLALMTFLIPEMEDKQDIIPELEKMETRSLNFLDDKIAVLSQQDSEAQPMFEAMIEAYRAMAAGASCVQAESDKNRLPRTSQGKPKGLAPGLNRQRRDGKGLTQIESARLCGVSVDTIRRWDHGKGTPSDYPGRQDAVAFRAWLARCAESKRLKQAMKNTIPYNEDKFSHNRHRSL